MAASDKPRQLLSIFCELELSQKDEAGSEAPIPRPPEQYLPLKELKIRTDTIFPAKAQVDTQAAYAALWRDFKEQAQILKAAHQNDSSDAEVYLRSWLKLMERYCWAIPSSYAGQRPNVSLYDHSRITAALAVCLAGQNMAAGPEFPPDDTEAALLVGGDISGVQDFIYTITSRGAGGRPSTLSRHTRGMK